MAAREGFRVSQKSSYHVRFCITFNVSQLKNNNFSFHWQKSMTDVPISLWPPFYFILFYFIFFAGVPRKGTSMASPYKAL